MGTAIKHPVPDWVKLSFVIFDVRALWRSAAYTHPLQLQCESKKSPPPEFIWIFSFFSQTVKNF